VVARYRLQRLSLQCGLALDHGFGIFVSKLGYNDQPDEVYRSVDLVVTRLGQLIGH
jgi:hypothetical protein